MKKRTALLISVVLCICIWAAACIPIHLQIQEAAFVPSFQYYSAVRAYFNQQEAAGPLDGDTVYLYTASNLAGREQNMLFCPWVEPIFRDVGTAGGSDWSVGLHYAVLSWDGKMLSPTQDASPGDSVCVVQPDKNTVLIPPHPSKYEYLKEIPKKDWKGEDTWFLYMNVVTENSTLSPNAAATATVQWNGEFYVRRTLWPSVKIPFSAVAEGTYLSNVC